jgi:hypothetical protein
MRQAQAGPAGREHQRVRTKGVCQQHHNLTNFDPFSAPKVANERSQSGLRRLNKSNIDSTCIAPISLKKGRLVGATVAPNFSVFGVKRSCL